MVVNSRIHCFTRSNNLRQRVETSKQHFLDLENLVLYSSSIIFTRQYFLILDMGESIRPSALGLHRCSNLEYNFLQGTYYSNMTVMMGFTSLINGKTTT